MNDRADLLTDDGFAQVALAFHTEDVHRQLVVHAQAEGGRIDDFEAALQGVLVADLGDLLGVRVDLGVGGVDAVDTVLGDEDQIGRASCRERV